MKVKIQKLNKKAKMPIYAKPGDAGMDLVAISKKVDSDGNVVYGTGIAMEIPEGYVGLIFPRSSNAKKDLLLSNCVGVIDSGYRGEITAKFKPSMSVHNPFKAWWQIFVRNLSKEYEVGDKIAQIIIMPYPQIEFELCDKLSETERGDGGYGSTGA
jgi:dUTP pyrophosphatase